MSHNEPGMAGETNELYEKLIKCGHMSSEPLVFAHRGGFEEAAIENTSGAFEYSRNIGVDVLELDVCMTKDKVVIVCHDTNLKRLTSSDCEISDINFDQLPHLSKDLWTCNDYIAFEESKTHFMTLEQFVEENKGKLVCIEPKQANEELVDQTLKIVRNSGMISKCIFGSFIHQTNKLLMNAIPSEPLFMSIVELLQLVVCSAIKPICWRKKRILIIPNLKKYKNCANRILLKFIFSLQAFRNMLLEFQIPVCVYGIEDEDDVLFARDSLMANALITDFPKKIMDIVGTRQESRIENSTR
ncbi:MAG: Lysophospholipase D gdpd1 [Marteilia pararefringens]